MATQNPKRISLVVQRTLSAPPERVFDAWLDPKQASQWLFHIPTATMVKAEIDARIGGEFIFTDRRDGVDYQHVGRYLDIERPKKLAFTFCVPKFSKEETTVTIKFQKKGKGCELTLTHEGVLPEWAEKSKEGWSQILERLDSSLEGALKIQ